MEISARKEYCKAFNAYLLENVALKDNVTPNSCTSKLEINRE